MLDAEEVGGHLAAQVPWQLERRVDHHDGDLEAARHLAGVGSDGERQEDMRRYTEIYGDIRRYTEIYGGIRRYTEIYGDIRRYTEI